jgi:hypothetical protein
MALVASLDLQLMLVVVAASTVQGLVAAVATVLLVVAVILWD